MEQPLTIVLPMHNQERRIRSAVFDVLEITDLDDAGLEVIVVDDGSTDDTFESACELARTFPQVHILRQATPRGLRGAMELVKRHRPASDLVLVHDGMTAFNAAELKHLLSLDAMASPTGRREGAAKSDHGRSRVSRRFAEISQLHQSMEHHHRRFSGFCWMRLETPLIPRRRSFDQADGPKPIANYLTNLPVGMSAVTSR